MRPPRRRRRLAGDGRSAQFTPRERLAERVASVPLARLEGFAALLLLVAALVPRVRDLDARFDRGAEIAIAAVNFERGETRSAFPLFNVYASVIDRHELVLAHRSPLVPWTAWAGARLFAPEGWAEDVVRSEAPEGFEFGLWLPSSRRTSSRCCSRGGSRAKRTAAKSG